MGLRVNASLLGTAFLLPRDYENLPSLVLVLADTHIKGDLVLLREKAKRTADVLGVSIPGEGSAIPRENSNVDSKCVGNIAKKKDMHLPDTH